MIIKRPPTPEQLKNLGKPSINDQLKAIDDFVNYAGLKLLELEEKQDVHRLSLQPRVDYTC